MFMLGLAIGAFIGGTVVHLVREVADAEAGCMPEDAPYDWAEEDTNHLAWYEQKKCERGA